MDTWMSCEAYKDLLRHKDRLSSQHLRTLLEDDNRNKQLLLSPELKGNGSISSKLYLDMSREKVDVSALKALVTLAEQRKVKQSIADMFGGKPINVTENRAALHTALRHPSPQSIGHDEVREVRDKVWAFAEKVRNGDVKGVTGKPLTSVLCVGIGGSFLGTEFIREALCTHPVAERASAGRQLRFLANVDPVDIKRALNGINAEETLIIIISKTFTTAETMLNSRTVVAWLKRELKSHPEAISRHVVAVSTNLPATTKFGILEENVFGFWDWVGGRFSVCSAVGLLPLSIHFGPSVAKSLLEGCHAMDRHYETAPIESNIPILMALISIWNSSFMGYDTVAVLPYAQALHRFTAHIQQLAMESNGKRTTLEGGHLTPPVGECFFGEAGTNGQHSFYQLLHQGRTIPAEFIGFMRSQCHTFPEGEAVSNHDELMSNFFAQPDALALGLTSEECAAQGVPASLIPHRTFPGDKPSLMLLLPECDAFNVGVLLSLYEHRTATEGFVWGINSFDQWGVELGKVLAKNVRSLLQQTSESCVDKAPNIILPSKRLLKEYMSNRDVTRAEYGSD